MINQFVQTNRKKNNGKHLQHNIKNISADAADFGHYDKTKPHLLLTHFRVQWGDLWPFCGRLVHPPSNKDIQVAVILDLWDTFGFA